ncbi:MAG TPA: YdaS family helix-turn-helix protein [Burkholderiales bacterium]|nr:YdaS family helix-turn-helix protein [Burkholderiales bacterium]
MRQGKLAEIIDRAVSTVGGGVKLAEILGVPAHEIILWSRGVHQPPRPLVVAIVELARQKTTA